MNPLNLLPFGRKASDHGILGRLRDTDINRPGSPSAKQQCTLDLLSIVYIGLLVVCCTLLFQRPQTTTSQSSVSTDVTAVGTSRVGRRLSEARQPESDVRLFVGVLSRSNNSVVRQAIRDTWAKDKRLAQVMFFVLRPTSNETFRAIREEAVQFNDVFVISHKYEDYFSITYSTLEIFKAGSVVPGITHVLKTDEDCFIRVDNMLEALENAPKTWMYGGGPLGTGEVINRDPTAKGRIYVPYSNWGSDDPLPTYAWGHGGVLTIDLVKHIAVGAPHMVMQADNLFVLEDASTGLWVKYIGEEQQHFINYVNLPFDRTICRPTDALTHLEKFLWPSLVEAHHCLYNGTCADRCTGVDPRTQPKEQQVQPPKRKTTRSKRKKRAALLKPAGGLV
eukprot:gene3893-4147_t